MITRVQSAFDSQSGGVSTQSVSLSSTQAGNLLLVGVLTDGNSPFEGVSSVTDNIGNTYTLISASIGYYDTLGDFSTASQFWYAKNAIAGVTSITVHYAVTTSHISQVFGLEYSGCSTTSPIEFADNITQGASAVTSPSLTSSLATDMFVVMAADRIAPTTTVDSPWTTAVASSYTCVGEYAPGSASVQQATFRASPTGQYGSSGIVLTSGLITKLLSDSLTPSSSISTLSGIAHTLTLTETVTMSEGLGTALNPPLRLFLSDSIGKVEDFLVQLTEKSASDSVVMQDWVRVRKNPAQGIWS